MERLEYMCARRGYPTPGSGVQSCPECGLRNWVRIRVINEGWERRRPWRWGIVIAANVLLCAISVLFLPIGWWMPLLTVCVVMWCPAMVIVYLSERAFRRGHTDLAHARARLEIAETACWLLLALPVILSTVMQTR